MKKRIAMLLLAAVLSTSLTACGNQPGQTQQPPTDNTPETAISESTDNPAPAPSTPGTDTADGTVQIPENPLSDAPSDARPSASEDAELTADSIGPVSFTPNEKGYSMVYGANTLHAYFKRQNVVPGNGKMIIRKTSDDSVIEEINLKDTQKCSIGEADTTFNLLGWNGGTHLIIQLKETPASGEAYYVNLEEGAFTSQDGAILSKAIQDKTTWSYGVAPYGVIPARPSGSDVLVGDVLSADILIRQPAVLAKIENYDENRVRFNDKEFEQDAKLEIKIYQIGEDPFTVTFYDNDDNPLGSITLSYTASMPPEPEEEAPKKSITNL